MTSARWLRLCAAMGSAPIVLFLLLHLHALFLPLPESLRHPPSFGARILDRDGRLIARAMASDGVFRSPFDEDHAGPFLVPALLAAEDQRFERHGGIDLLAIARAATAAALRGRFVSGASTITQQLARSTFERPRTLLGKWHEMALALRIERDLEKSEILGEYLNRVHFGTNIVGVVAAADHYFGKPLDALSLGEAATLVGLVRGPSLFDPRSRPELARGQRDRVLTRMVSEGAATTDEADLARSSPVDLLPRPPLPGARHWVRQASRSDKAVVTTTLVGPLQRQVENLVLERSRQLRELSAHEAAVVILDNESGDILAWVGSPDFFNEVRGGQNDGVFALRQPGSTLKPFLYAFAMEELGMNPQTLLPDEPLHLRTVDSYYAPRNFDRIFRGQVTLSRALANSLNVPAVYVAHRLGVPRVLQRLREVGLEALSGDPEYYGPALALGDGEVTLLQLTDAYATLARGGVRIPPRFAIDQEPGSPRRVLSPDACALVAEVLSDDVARREVFGASNHLDLPFPVAVKTGTSKGYRDSWTIGFTKAITVGVWVGNFDGEPTRRVTGARGAGHLFHRVMRVAEQELGARVSAPGAQRPLHDVALHQVELRQGDLRQGDLRQGEPRQGEPRQEEPRQEEPSPSERRLLFWTSRNDHSPEKLLEPKTVDTGLRVEFPKEGMVFDFDEAIPEERQRVVLRSSGSGAVDAFRVNDEVVAARDGRAEWTIRPGRFALVAVGRDQAGREHSSSPVRFAVSP